MAFVKVGSTGRGEVYTAADLTAAPVTSLTMDVRFLENISLGCFYTQGGGSSVTEIQITCEASYDEGATWAVVTINPDIGTPPDKGFADGSMNRLVSASDSWSMPHVEVESLPLIRLIANVVGAAAAGDLLTINAYGENETGG